MTLQETQEIITRWIDSAETTYQLDLLLEIMDKFVFERFANIATPIELELAKTDLKESWLTRKLIVAKNS